MNRFGSVVLSLVSIVGFELISFAQPSTTITTYAGIGHWPVSGTQASTQPIGYAVSVIPDAFGGFYMVGYDQHRIYRVAADGTVAAIAGTGTAGFSGDGGPALSAQLNGPGDVVLDAAGNLFIADSGNHRIRKVTPDGVITTITGAGTQGFSGDFSPAVSAQLSYPRGVAVDSDGNLFISDSSNERIRKVTLMGPVLILDSTQYRVGDSWNLKVSYGVLNTPVRLLGTSNGQSWEIPEWGTTDDGGSFKVEGSFAEGTEGSHSIRVEIGGVFSNSIAFVVSH